MLWEGQSLCDAAMAGTSSGLKRGFSTWRMTSRERSSTSYMSGRQYTCTRNHPVSWGATGRPESSQVETKQAICQRGQPTGWAASRHAPCHLPVS